ncbi:hypothetical protein NHX12_005533 [Muraenolepis orangiensis]|uniref:Uncharacterized protein n=1 Tax=Muraenolepis orangiensis TaxID=630683 RepID=A0A9Q0DRR7_9TELE|nr:hypothetical protein NHX12_005533 [Muraenolepis orangiensis]
MDDTVLIMIMQYRRDIDELDEQTSWCLQKTFAYVYVSPRESAAPSVSAGRFFPGATPDTVASKPLSGFAAELCSRSHRSLVAPGRRGPAADRPLRGPRTGRSEGPALRGPRVTNGN